MPPSSGASNQHKRRPIVWMGMVRAQFLHRALEGGRFAGLYAKPQIKVPHQLRRGVVLNVPQAEQQRFRPGIKQSSDQTEKFIALGDYIEAGATAAQSDEFGRQSHLIKVVERK